MTRCERAAFVSVLVLSAALIAAPWHGHVDDVDAQLYVVIVRNMVADRTWFDLRYLPDLFPRFREHLPFGFWPAAAAARWLGEWAIGPLYGLFTLGTIALAGLAAARRFGAAAGIATALCLGTCDSIWQYGGRLLLDPPLLFFATFAAAAALDERPRWIVAAASAAAAVLVKGPFGLVPLASVVLARAVAERSGVTLVRGGLACAGALLPTAAFLVADAWLSHGTWWSGYIRDQIAASALGTRHDGVSAWWYPLRVVGGRFWPGLPLLGLAALAARRDRRAATICLASTIAVALLCVPARKWGRHAYVVFPLLAIAAGAGAASLAASWIRRPANSRGLALTLAFASVAAWCASVLGAGRLVLRPPCVVSTEFAPLLAPYAPATRVWVPRPVDWGLITELAEERRLVPTVERTTTPELVILREGLPRPSSFRDVGRARGLLLLERVP
ncbi:MAG: hypothetical protein ACJ79O_11225 [Myxococcales bacterium]